MGPGSPSDAPWSQSNPSVTLLHPGSFRLVGCRSLLSCRYLLVLSIQEEFSIFSAVGAKPSSPRGQNLTKKAWKGSSLLLVQLRLVPHTYPDQAGLTPVMVSPTLRPVPKLAMSSCWMLFLLLLSALLGPPLVPSPSRARGTCVTMGTAWGLESLVQTPDLSLTIWGMLGKSCNHLSFHLLICKVGTMKPTPWSFTYPTNAS